METHDGINFVICASPPRQSDMLRAYPSLAGNHVNLSKTSVVSVSCLKSNKSRHDRQRPPSPPPPSLQGPPDNGTRQRFAVMGKIFPIVGICRSVCMYSLCKSAQYVCIYAMLGVMPISPYEPPPPSSLCILYIPFNVEDCTYTSTRPLPRCQIQRTGINQR